MKAYHYDNVIIEQFIAQEQIGMIGFCNALYHTDMHFTSMEQIKVLDKGFSEVYCL